MRSRIDLTHHMLDRAYNLMIQNIEGVSIEEAVFVPVGGFRSILGILKHATGWSHVYRSYAFDQKPLHWQDVSWPHGLRDTIIQSQEYFADVIEWFREAHRLWYSNLKQITDDKLDDPRPLHWGEKAPLV